MYRNVPAVYILFSFGFWLFFDVLVHRMSASECVSMFVYVYVCDMVVIVLDQRTHKYQCTRVHTLTRNNSNECVSVMWNKHGTCLFYLLRMNTRVSSKLSLSCRIAYRTLPLLSLLYLWLKTYSIPLTHTSSRTVWLSEKRFYFSFCIYMWDNRCAEQMCSRILSPIPMRATTNKANGRHMWKENNIKNSCASVNIVA